MLKFKINFILLKRLLPRLVLLGLSLWGWTFVMEVWERQPKIALNQVFGKEELIMPVMLREFPSLDRFAIVEKGGLIKWVYPSSFRAEGVILDIRKRVFSSGYEEGLLSIAFDPNFEKNRYYYIFYSMDKPLRSRVSRFRMNEDLSTDMNSELLLFEIEKPGLMHNGGMLEFGPDGYLYISVGEGSFPTREEADLILPSRKAFYGSILRIDVTSSDSNAPYQIPNDNPFIGQDNDIKKEIWTYGFRNPWRFSFDHETGYLYVSDVGGIRYEEVNLIEKGQNNGWPIMEGNGCRYSTDHGRCDKTGKTLPLASFSHNDNFLCITGGIVYRGNQLPSLKNQFIFSDFTSGLYAFDLPKGKGRIPNPTSLHPAFELVDGLPTRKNISISSISLDHLGGLYLVNYKGKIYTVEPLNDPSPWKSFFRSLFAGRN